MVVKCPNCYSTRVSKCEDPNIKWQCDKCKHKFNQGALDVGAELEKAEQLRMEKEEKERRERTMGIIRGICISEKKGTQKHEIPQAELKTEWGIEGEGSGFQLVEGELAVGAGVLFAVGGLACAEPVHGDEPVAGLETELHGVREASGELAEPSSAIVAFGGGDHQAVDDDVD